MRKAFYIIAFLALSINNLKAQSPAISELRQIISERPTQFNGLQKDLLKDNTETGVKIYSSKFEDSSISRSLITRSVAEGTIYIITFNVKSMDAMKLRVFMILAQQYIDEMNVMVKSGNYKGRDYEDNGENITEITDLNDNIVMQYVSSADTHLVLVFGVK